MFLFLVSILAVWFVIKRAKDEIEAVIGISAIIGFLVFTR
jgi:Ca2+/Na+ antiporter